MTAKLKFWLLNKKQKCSELMNPTWETENYSAEKTNNPRVCIAHSFQSLQLTNGTKANISVHSGMCNSLY